ncbi:MAG: hypothetical protein K6G16_06150 [Lachnospiraceae bacterium]|nr:hypothetical protein [Lachnospiraceae bacterium]
MALMIEDKRTPAGKLIVGIELTGRTVQASFLRPDAEEPETLSAVAGAEAYDIPLVLARRRDNGKWLFGREAEQAARDGEAVRVDRLLELAVRGGSITVGSEEYQGVPLLALCFKKLFSLLVAETAGIGAGTDLIEALQITVDEPDDDTVRVLEELKEELKRGLPGIRRIEWCTHAESLFSYLRKQPEEIRAQEVLAFWCRDDRLVSFRHEINMRTRPFVAGVGRTEEEPLPQGAGTSADEAFLHIAEARLSEHIVSAVYLLGDGFDESWLKQSLDYICRGRRVFLGNNLFSRGAALCMREKLSPAEEGAKIVFLGPDKVMANVGIRCKKQGESHYHALIDAGTGWYDVHVTLDLILDKDERIALEVTPLSAGPARTEVLELDGLHHLAVRGRRATRVTMELTMISVDRLRLAVVDRGFGDYFPSSGGHWERFIGLGPAESGAALSEGVVSEPLLCVGSQAKYPYEFRFLESRVFSAEELCYFIAKNDYLLTMDAFSESLCDWLDRECCLRPLADELREVLKRKCSPAVFAETILDYIRYFPADEIARISQVLRSGDARDGVEKRLKIIEYLIREVRYAEAWRMIRGFDRQDRHPVVLARLFYDEGVIYARLFHYGAAAACMEKAYTLSGDAQVKEAYLAALRLSMSEEEYINEIGSRPELSPESLTLETRLGETLDLFAAGADNHLVNTLQVYLDTDNTVQFDRETARAEEELLARYERVTG